MKSALFALPFCAALLAIASLAPAQDAAAPPPAPQETPPAKDASGESVTISPPQQGIVPASSVDAATYSIPDIRQHRGAELSYVRRLADIVHVNLPPLDLTADPVLVVGDQAISADEYRRRALMYAAGNEIDKHVTHLLTQQEIDRQVAEGADRASFTLDEAEVDRKIAEIKELIMAQNRQGAAPPAPGEPDPGARAVEIFEHSINTSIGMEAYRALQAADAAFEKVFLPVPEGKVEGVPHDMTTGPPPLDEPAPEWMPVTTWNALGSDEQGRNLRSFVKQWAIEGQGIPAMFKPSILARIKDGLLSTVGVAFFFDEELPPDIFMRVGGQLVPTTDLWYAVADKLADADNDLIVRELLTLSAMKKGLTAAGRWLDNDAFQPLWDKHLAEYANTILPLKSIIIFRGYTSLDRYREHYRYRQGYNEWRRATLTDEEVLEHYQGGGRLFFERGNVVVDVAFQPVGERPFNNASLEASRAELEAFMAQAKAEWQREQTEGTATAPADAGPGDAAWFARVSRMLPGPETQQGGDGHSFQRSQLRMRMAEDELSIFVTGYSLADDVFYHAQRGEVCGPWPERSRQHAWGAEANAGSWALSVKDFNRSGPVKAFEGTNRDLAYEDYLDLNYFFWAQESLKALLPSVKVPAR
jgi:hypothetical protein